MSAVALIDLKPPADTMRAQVLAGLSADQKTLPSQYFYDQTGAALFEQICELDEYYPTRTELSILRAHLPAMVAAIGPDAAVIEPGSGSGLKTRLLLEALTTPRAYMPIDVAREQLLGYTRQLAEEFPELCLCPVCADFTAEFPLPATVAASPTPLLYFPGSTIGNFPRPQAQALLRRWRRSLGPRGRLLIGVDLKKPAALLKAAYDDAQGLTAAFNRNILAHINQRLGADFDPPSFAHRATYDEASGYVQMWLVSRRAQQVRLDADTVIDFAEGEAILTEYSCKYAPADFVALAATAGWSAQGLWTDPRRWFSVQLFAAS